MRSPLPHYAALTLIALALIILSTASTPTAAQTQAGPIGYLQSFDNDPTAPQPWRPADWDVTVHSRDKTSWYELPPVDASHGPDCGAPPATHTVTSYEGAVFQCRNHVMTAINGSAGYGAIYLTPNQLLDFSKGEASLRFDMSTFRSSGRDWIEIWVSPYSEQLQAPIFNVPDLSGPPRRALLLRMSRRQLETGFDAVLFNNFSETKLPQASRVNYEQVLKPDSARRDTFELRLSKNRVRFGMPAYNLWWVDTALPGLDWSQGVVQLSQHSYNPEKNCELPCWSNTWHWDNVQISPSLPFTILRADRRFVDGRSTEKLVRFPTPAPASGFLRFMGVGRNLEVSFDGGATWEAAVAQQQQPPSENSFRSYWTELPAGTRQVQFRGEDWFGGVWHVRDISVWSSPTSCQHPRALPGSGPAPEPAPFEAAGEHFIFLPQLRLSC